MGSISPGLGTTIPSYSSFSSSSLQVGRSSIRAGAKRLPPSAPQRDGVPPLAAQRGPVLESEFKKFLRQAPFLKPPRHREPRWGFHTGPASLAAAVGAEALLAQGTEEIAAWSHSLEKSLLWA